MSNSNTWKDLNECEQKINMNRIIRVRDQYLKLSNCVQTNKHL